MVVDELFQMSRFKGSNPVPRGGSQPAVGVLSPHHKPALNASVTMPAPRPSSAQLPPQRLSSGVVRESDLNNPLRKLGLYLALAFIFCRFSLFGELVTNTLNF